MRNFNNCIRRSRILKTLLFSTIIFGFLFYVIDFHALRIPLHQHLQRMLHNDTQHWQDFRHNLEEKWDKAYFVNTIGCKMPSFTVWNDVVRESFVLEKQIVCRKPLTISSDKYLWIGLNQTEMEIIYGIKDVKKLNCLYQTFTRNTDYLNDFSPKVNFFEYNEIVKIEDEFIRVKCFYDGNSTEMYINYHYFVPMKSLNRTLINSSPEVPNIVIFGIDAVSRLNFHRQMNKTVDTVLNRLKAIELFGYNKVEDNTYPNLIPMLTGLNESEFEKTCLPTRKSVFDACHFIWDTYEQMGYMSLYAEEVAWMGLFHYLRSGFKNQSTDYSLRPIIYEMEAHASDQLQGNCYMCLGGQRSADLIMDYMRKFTVSMKSQAYFSLYWITSYSHDYFNYPRLIDTEVSDLLIELYAGNAMDNTFTFFMSDHGIRWGTFRNTYQGMMEERQPYLYLIPPKWFPEKYPSAYKNLLLNQRKLTTHFDLHETLRDLLILESITPTNIQMRSKDLLDLDVSPRGISLFLPVPSSRTCAMAGIAPHWCTCHERKDIAVNDPKAIRAAQLITETINSMIQKYPQCEQLTLNVVKDAFIGISNVDIVSESNKTINHFLDMSVRIQTAPGLGEFEGTVRFHWDNRLEMTGSISRTNLYGKQSQCIDDYKMKLYCYCIGFL